MINRKGFIKFIVAILVLSVVLICSVPVFADENEYSYNSDYAGLLGQGLEHDERFSNSTIRYGIDVSYHQGEIDWQKVKGAGAEFAIVRVGYRGYESGTIVEDLCAEYNVKEVLKNDLVLGVYFYSQAITVDEGIEEADFVIGILEDYGLEPDDLGLPVVYDVEYPTSNGSYTGRLYRADLSKEERTAITLAFLERVEEAGYRGCLYGSRGALRGEIKCDMSQIDGKYPIWLAAYIKSKKAGYEGDYSIWQHSCYGKVDGINYPVDVDVWYDDGKILNRPDDAQAEGQWIQNSIGWWYRNPDGSYPKNSWMMYKNKWYHFDERGYMQTDWQKINGKWYYFNKSGAMQTGWRQINNNWYYFENSGKMLTGWQKISNKWYFLNSSGAMQTGWQVISGNTYYFKSSGAMAANEWCQGWWLNANGTWTYKYKACWNKNSNGWWFGDASGWYAKNTTITIDGSSYTFNNKGYWVQ